MNNFNDTGISIKITDNREHADKMLKAIRENDGYCPCQLERTEDTKCMCKDFFENVESGTCRCGLYIKDTFGV